MGKQDLENCMQNVSKMDMQAVSDDMSANSLTPLFSVFLSFLTEKKAVDIILPDK